MMPTLSPFPSGKTRLAGASPAGLAYRAAAQSDLVFLKRLYAHSRAEEMRSVALPQAMKEAFLDSQFHLQHEHYVRHYPDAAFLVVERGDEPIGRIYVEQRDSALHLIDISLLSEIQGKGIGTAIVTLKQSTARSTGRDVTLQVSLFNHRAQALYERLGFHVESKSATHATMRWIS